MKKFFISYVNFICINFVILINVILIFYMKTSFPLILLYNKSLKQGILPNARKEAIVIAIHKKDSKQQACN